MPTIRQMAAFRRRVVREALRTGNISQTARINKVTRQTVHRWIARYDGTLESLIDRSKRPHYHPTQHREEEIRRVLSVQRQNKSLGLVCLWIRLRQRFGYKRSISALYRLLRREGIMPPPGRKRRHKSKPYEQIPIPGARIQVDVKYVPKECLVGSLAGRKAYQYTAIDECTRWRFAAIYDELSAWNSMHFVKELRKRFPFEIACIQTDNGSEFTSRLQGAKYLSAFEVYLADEGIEHKYIKVATPRHNGKVERSHRSDQERFYEHRTFFSLRYLKDQFIRYLGESNHQPLMAHNWRSASDMLRHYQEVV